ncbi:hypothetical protein EOD39_4930 [Acipenser ruthenus]|uniref:Uncharacterized protein n=1 Tax=Acipenser ruthenus TaxID=7906 RepID=A0A444UGA7_ACIRT|nr:hypothetical protein EOD39_4930 [Acipenser ruthenus]
MLHWCQTEAGFNEHSRDEGKLSGRRSARAGGTRHNCWEQRVDKGALEGRRQDAAQTETYSRPREKIQPSWRSREGRRYSTAWSEADIVLELGALSLLTPTRPPIAEAHAWPEQKSAYC